MCVISLYRNKIARYCGCLFDHSRRDAIARKHVNGSRKFPLRLNNRRHEVVDTIISVITIEGGSIEYTLN